MLGDRSSTSGFIMSEEGVMQKRAYNGNKYGEPPAKKPMPSITIASGFKWNLQALANAADAVETGGKSPVSALNELGVKVSYTVVRQGGPAHCPSFDVAVHIADMTYQGWGHSKREARAAAARACLSALLARAGRVLASGDANHDFTQDVLLRETAPQFQYTSNPPPQETKPEVTSSPVSSATPDVSPSSALFGAVKPSAALAKSPINLLYENYPGLNFTCTFGDGTPLTAPQAPLQLSHSMRFKVVCQIKDQIYEGYGSSKKLAKLAAARAALAVLNDGKPEPQPSAPSPYGALPQVMADHIAKIVNEKFNELMKDDLIHSKRKVLAGIVITTEDRIEGAKIIAVTTGTKCVSGEHMSVRGRAVNDCHAEVAARRCLQRYLYSQLLQYTQQPDPSVTIESSDIEPCSGSGAGYRLKPSRRVHLYVSTAPCGDGRIFSPHEHREPAPDPHPNRQARGQLRTKIESGEGTIPVKNSNYIQTWDGVMQGERLLTMSCSDKVARWCVVGLQGALLSRLLRPVYLHSLVLGSLLHPHHMYRALCGRIESHMSALPWPYRLHRPLLARAASTEARTPARAPSFSVCWCTTTPQPEILNAMTGKLENGQPSLLCKQTMFARWHYLLDKLKPLPQESLDLESKPPALPENPSAMLYCEAKMLCPEYQAAKKCLFEAFESAKLGKWIKKPLEQDEFCCEILNADPKHLFAWAGDDLRYNTMQEPVRVDRGLEYGNNKAIVSELNVIGDRYSEIDDLGEIGKVYDSKNEVNDEFGCYNKSGRNFDDTHFSSKVTADCNFNEKPNDYKTNKQIFHKIQKSTVEGKIYSKSDEFASLEKCDNQTNVYKDEKLHTHKIDLLKSIKTNYDRSDISQNTQKIHHYNTKMSNSWKDENNDQISNRLQANRNQGISKNEDNAGEFPKNKLLLRKLEIFKTSNDLISVMKPNITKLSNNAVNSKVLKENNILKVNNALDENSISDNYILKANVANLIPNLKKVNITDNNTANVRNLTSENRSKKTNIMIASIDLNTHKNSLELDSSKIYAIFNSHNILKNNKQIRNLPLTSNNKKINSKELNVNIGQNMQEISSKRTGLTNETKDIQNEVVKRFLSKKLELSKIKYVHG